MVFLLSQNRPSQNITFPYWPAKGLLNQNALQILQCQRPHVTNEDADLVLNAPNAMETTHPSSATTLIQHFNPLLAIAQTPIDIRQLQSELTGYSTLLKQKLILSLQEGFDIGYRGPHVSGIAKNLQFAYQYPEPLCENIMQELVSKHVAGPFLACLYQTFAPLRTDLYPKKTTGK